MDHNAAVKHEPLPDKYQSLSNEILNIAISIHKRLGPGLLESVYEKCFCYELNKRGISFKCQEMVPIFYDEVMIDKALRTDILVDDLIIIELKSNQDFQPIWESQLLTYLRLTGKRLGFILNFNGPLMKNGIKRMIL